MFLLRLLIDLRTGDNGCVAEAGHTWRFLVEAAGINKTAKEVVGTISSCSSLRGLESADDVHCIVYEAAMARFTWPSALRTGRAASGDDYNAGTYDKWRGITRLTIVYRDFRSDQISKELVPLTANSSELLAIRSFVCTL